MGLSFKLFFVITATVFIWASAFVGIRAGLQDYSPGGLALLRFLTASVTILIIYYIKPTHRNIVFKDLVLALLTGAIGIGCYNICLNYGERLVPASTASFIISLSPIITTLFAAAFLNERINLYSFIGMAISILGVTLILMGSHDEFKFYISIIYIFIATLVSGFYSILQKSLLKKYNVIDITAYAVWGSTLILLIFIPNLIQDIHHASYKITLIVVYLGIFPGALAYLSWSYILYQIPASRAVSFLYFSPLFATLLGWVCLAEIPSVLTLIGGGVALLGVYIVNYIYKIQKEEKLISSI